MKRTYFNTIPEVPKLWPIKKLLTLSDVDTAHPFLTLPRQSVETHIVMYMTPQQQDHLRREGQVNLNAQDEDTGDAYEMKLKWRGSYYNLIGRWGKIVRGKGLDAGQEINLRWLNGCLFFSVSQQQQLTGPPPPELVLPPRMIAAPVMWAPQERENLRNEDQVTGFAYGDIGLAHDDWPIKKVLTSSDVDVNHPFLTLPGKAVEDHILFYWGYSAREQLRNERQVGINARDGDTGDVYVMKLRWRGSYYNLIGKWGKIIREKMLCVGREIRVRWEDGCLIFSVPQ